MGKWENGKREREREIGNKSEKSRVANEENCELEFLGLC